MSARAITAHALLPPAEAHAAVLAWLEELGLELAYDEGGLLIAWVDDAIDPGDEGVAGIPSLVVEVQIHPLDPGVQVRWSFRRGDGPLEGALAGEIGASVLRHLADDSRWVVAHPAGPRR